MDNKRKKQQSVLNYFNKLQNTKPRELDVPNQTENKKIHEPNQVEFEKGPAVNNELGNDNTEALDLINNERYDVSNFTYSKLNNDEKIDILENIWKPEPNFLFPSVSIGKEKIKRSFKYNWLLQYPWLAYSKNKNGVFCKYCVLFAKQFTARSNSQILGQFVNECFCNWRKSKEKFQEHQEYSGDNLKNIVHGNSKSVVALLDTYSTGQIMENRKKLFPVIKTVIFCGRNGLALRGHRDFGQMKLDSDHEEQLSEGNFRQLLRFRVDSGDLTLKTHLETTGKNATYISSIVQNEIIDSCNIIILKKIIEKVNKSKCFSILADETTDISTQEQLSICVRFIEGHEGNLNVCENFLQFVTVTSTCGDVLAQTILDTLNNLGLDLKYLRGQGYDGAAAMAGKYNGVQAKIRAKFQTALYVHCASHSLNLAISDACQVKDIRNCMGVIEKCYSFMHTPKRNAVLQEGISKLCPSSKRETLKKLSPTRWIERHESVMVMVELFHPLVYALEKIENWNDKESSSAACLLLNSIKTSSFVISMLTIQKVFSYTLALCRILQSKSLDLVIAVRICGDVIKELENLRNTAESSFSNIFTESLKILKEIDQEFEVSLPRITGRQTNRCNINVETPEMYYRICIFNEFLDSTILSLKERFMKHKLILESLNILIPGHNDNPIGFVDKLEILLKTYSLDLENCNLQTLIAEYQLWLRKFQLMKKAPESAIESLQMCDKVLYPNVFKLLKILVTLPVTTCTSERSFSTLKYLKSYLRNSTSENRLNGLSLLYIYKNIKVDEEEVLNILQKHKRKLNICL